MGYVGTGSWQQLDLSAVVPKEARMVDLLVENLGPGSAFVRSGSGIHDGPHVLGGQTMPRRITLSSVQNVNVKAPLGTPVNLLVEGYAFNTSY